MRPQVKPTDLTARAYLAALQLEDKTLMEARRALDNAVLAWQLSKRKYASVRDLFIEKYGLDPYCLDWTEFGAQPSPTEGQYRYIDMNPGEAAMQVLMAAEGPLNLDDIQDELRHGGLSFADARTINAALMALRRKGDAMQLSEGTYEFQENGEDDEEEVTEGQ